MSEESKYLGTVAGISMMGQMSKSSGWASLAGAVGKDLSKAVPDVIRNTATATKTVAKAVPKNVMPALRATGRAAKYTGKGVAAAGIVAGSGAAKTGRGGRNVISRTGDLAERGYKAIPTKLRSPAAQGAVVAGAGATVLGAQGVHRFNKTLPNSNNDYSNAVSMRERLNSSKAV